MKIPVALLAALLGTAHARFSFNLGVHGRYDANAPCSTGWDVNDDQLQLTREFGSYECTRSSKELGGFPNKDSSFWKTPNCRGNTHADITWYDRAAGPSCVKYERCGFTTCMNYHRSRVGDTLFYAGDDSGAWPCRPRFAGETEPCLRV
ncbi:uncharacterized protein K489DRAFT_374157 [Dissoconium aciculare CBS 342.82]|jgi:hypothetical protein|uniref:Secreted protein n=1 Tax=Dissoconium aciculare CBS 342.82 TaxID=1314786 RepID=A0A6J3LSB9_9PEZI|nr:uncharacterized protein K489DRAFT_374157 [Dissoconium aciculare CBS 342.82]KAF1818528.1 hypothetical protein K489DRAFT_374157 [Dissoconium aciculare CBS 342.82]